MSVLSESGPSLLTVSTVRQDVVIIRANGSVTGTRGPGTPPVTPSGTTGGLFILISTVQLNSLSELRGTTLTTLLESFSAELWVFFSTPLKDLLVGWSVKIPAG